VAGHGNRLFPGTDIGLNPTRQDGGAEHRAVQDGADGAVGTRPHLFQVEFLHALGVGGDGRALDAHAVFLDGLGRGHGVQVVGVVPFFHIEVVILRIQVHIGLQQLFFHHAPEVWVISSPSISTMVFIRILSMICFLSYFLSAA
jgi:hypothetical protein